MIAFLLPDVALGPVGPCITNSSPVTTVSTPERHEDHLAEPQLKDLRKFFPIVPFRGELLGYHDPDTKRDADESGARIQCLCPTEASIVTAGL